MREGKGLRPGVGRQSSCSPRSLAWRWRVTHFLLGMATGVFICTAIFGYLTYKLYTLFKHGA